MDVFKTSEQAKKLYNTLVSEFTRSGNKLHILQQITEAVRTIRNTDIKELQREVAHNVLRFKIRMESQFMRDVHCTYRYLLATPKDYGCDIRELIYNTKEGTPLYPEILTAFAEAAAHIEPKIIHILTDIDDTLFPHPQLFAGTDYSWISKKPYPGVIEFYKTFYDNIINKSQQYSTVLSATPAAMKGSRLEDPVLKEILGETFGFLQGADSKHEALSSLTPTARNTSFVDREAFGALKFKRFIQYSSMFPEYKLLFIGDNGQGDVIAGKKMLEASADCMVFIHNLYNRTEFINTPAEIDEITKSYPGRFFFFYNYLDLAHIFSKLGMFTSEQLQDIRQAVIDDLRHAMPQICPGGLDSCIESNPQLKQYICCIDKSTCVLGEHCISTKHLRATGGKRRRSRRSRKTRKNRK